MSEFSLYLGMTPFTPHGLPTEQGARPQPTTLEIPAAAPAPAQRNAKPSTRLPAAKCASAIPS